MNILQKELLADLTRRTREVISDLEELKKLPLEQLNFKTSPESWSALECVEHLNRYGRFYLPEIKIRLDAAKTLRTELFFKSGWLGNYMAKSVAP